MVADNMSDSPLGDAHQMMPQMESNGPHLMVRSEDQLMALPPHSNLFCSRKQREFTPDSKKDDTYWDRRRRNNAAAKRSREKRRLNDMLLEKRVVQLSRENHILRAQVTSVYKSYGIRAETLVDMDQVMATLPTEDQLLNLTCSGSSSRSGLESPPPPSMISGMPSPPQSIIGAQSPTRLEEAFTRSQHGHHYSTSPPTKVENDLGCSSRPLDFSREDDLMPPASKRAYLEMYVNSASSSESSSSGQRSSPVNSTSNSSCESNDDPLNLTCNSRSRSSSETEEEMVQHMPHKLRYKYHQHMDQNGPPPPNVASSSVINEY